MTNDKPFRELKFTSAQLAVVFLAILAFGVGIFFLGISVGKKQTEIASGAGSGAKTEVLAQKSPLPADAPPKVTIQETPAQTAPAQKAADAETKTEKKSADQKVGENAAVKDETGAGVKATPAAPKSVEAKTAADEKKPADTPADAKKEPAAKEGKTASSKQEGIFYVQIGAVNDKEAADGFAKKIEGLGYPALVLLPLAKDKKPVYRVRIGPYATKQDADAAQDKIAADLKKKKTDFFIVKG